MKTERRKDTHGLLILGALYLALFGGVSLYNKGYENALKDMTPKKISIIDIDIVDSEKGDDSRADILKIETKGKGYIEVALDPKLKLNDGWGGVKLYGSHDWKLGAPWNGPNQGLAYGRDVVKKLGIDTVLNVR